MLLEQMKRLKMRFCKSKFSVSLIKLSKYDFIGKSKKRFNGGIIGIYSLRSLLTK